MKRELLPHQKTVLDEIKDNPDTKRWGLMLEPGLGKTKLALEVALLLKDKVKNIIIIAPSGLKANWLNEIAMETNWTDKDYHFISYSMLSLKRSNIRELIVKDSLVIIDESHYLKNPKANRTKSIISLLKKVNDIYLLSLTGTPNPRNILDMWIQCTLLEAWTGSMPLTYWNFCNMYGKWIQIQQFRKFVGEQNRDMLLLGFKHKAFFIKKEDVLDLPPKLYEVQTYELSAEQKKQLKNLKAEAISQVEPSMDYMTATIHNYLMICSGFMNAKYNEDGVLYDVAKPIELAKNPKLDLLELFIDSNEEKCIIYCSYRYEIVLIEQLLAKLGKSYVVRKGDLGVTANQTALEDFKTKDIQYLIATVQSTSVGLNITECNLIVYFSNTYDLMHRIQSEDRIYRLGQTKTCTYIDLVGVNAPDNVLLESIKTKKTNLDHLFKAFVNM